MSESKGQIDRATLAELRTQVAGDREFNFCWVARHGSDGHPVAAAIRRAYVAKCDRWIGALDAVLAE